MKKILIIILGLITIVSSVSITSAFANYPNQGNGTNGSVESNVDKAKKDNQPENTMKLINESFESPQFDFSGQSFQAPNESQVPGWKTTDSSGTIEFMTTFKQWNINSVKDGRQFVDLVAIKRSSLYQDISGPEVTAGRKVKYSFWHHSFGGNVNDGTDVVKFTAGLPGTDNNQNEGGADGPDTLVTGNRYTSQGFSAKKDEGWTQHTGEFTIPDDVNGSLRIAFGAVTASSGSNTGNYLDSVQFEVENEQIFSNTVDIKSPNTNEVLKGDKQEVSVEITRKDDKNDSPLETGKQFLDIEQSPGATIPVSASVEYLLPDGTQKTENLTITNSAGSNFRLTGFSSTYFNSAKITYLIDTKLVNTKKFDVYSNWNFKSKANVTAEANVWGYDYANILEPKIETVKTVKAGQKSPVQVGDEVVYELSIKNSGDGVSKGNVLTDRIDTRYDFVAATDGGTESNGTVTWNVGDLKPGESKTVSLTLKVNASAKGGDELPNVVVTTNKDPKSPETPVNPTPVPVVEEKVETIKSIKPGQKTPVKIGDEVEYVITVQNIGEGTSTEKVVTDTIDSRYDFVSADGNGKLDGSTVKREVGKLLPGEKVTFNIKLKVNKNAKNKDQLPNTVVTENKNPKDPVKPLPPVNPPLVPVVMEEFEQTGEYNETIFGTSLVVAIMASTIYYVTRRKLK